MKNKQYYIILLTLIASTFIKCANEVKKEQLSDEDKSIIVKHIKNKNAKGLENYLSKLKKYPKNIDLNFKAEFEEEQEPIPPLMMAVVLSHIYAGPNLVEIIKILLKNNANPNFGTYHKLSNLSASLMHPRIGEGADPIIGLLLLEYGANPCYDGKNIKKILRAIEMSEYKDQIEHSSKIWRDFLDKLIEALKNCKKKVNTSEKKK